MACSKSNANRKEFMADSSQQKKGNKAQGRDTGNRGEKTTTTENNKTKSYFEKINKIDKLLARLTKKRLKKLKSEMKGHYN